MLTTFIPFLIAVSRVAVANIEAPSYAEVPLCSAGILQLLDGSQTFILAQNSRDHVAPLAQEGDTLDVSLFENETNLVQPVRCTLRVETCPNCVIRIRHAAPIDFFNEREIRMMPSCIESMLDPCFDLRFVEEKADTAMDLVYRKISIWEEPAGTEIVTTGDSVVIVATFWNIDSNSTLNSFIENLFPLHVSSLSNTEHVMGLPSESILMANQTSIGFIQSPRYPSSYPRSLSKTYTLSNIDQNGFVRLTFDDFHVHFQSELMILDSDGTLLVNTKNDHRRPPAVLSKGPNLTVQFEAHDFTQMVGFRARYEFVQEHDWPEKPNSRLCDDHLEGYGGDIKLDGETHLVNSYIDCIWIIGRFPHMSRTFDRIYLRVEEFHLHGVGLRLEVREGASSTSDRILLLFDQQSKDQLEHKQPRHGFATSLSSPAYYVRLRGFLMSTKGLEIVYSQFYRWATALCPGIGEFHCDNARCVKATLRCDGVNHCGDNSDEQCHRDVDTFQPPDADVSGLLAMVVGVCGLVLLLISTTAILARVYRRRLSAQVGTSRHQPGNPGYPPEVTPSIQVVGERRFYVVPDSQISVIEAPPSYDDALKHPTVTSNRQSAYSNHGFSQSSSQEGFQRTVSPAEPPPILEELCNQSTSDQTTIDQSIQRPSSSRSCMVSPRRTTSQMEDTVPQESVRDPSRPGTSQEIERDEESWV